MIEKGRCERAQQPIVRDLDLNPVEAGLYRISSAHRETVNDGADIIFIHRLRAKMARWLGHLSRRPHDMRWMLERSVAGVCELAENFCAVGVNCVRDIPQQRNDRRIPSIDKSAGHLASRMNGLALENDQGDTSAGALLVIGHMSIRRLSIKGAQGSEMWLEDKAIVKFNVADLERAE